MRTFLRSAILLIFAWLAVSPICATPPNMVESIQHLKSLDALLLMDEAGNLTDVLFKEGARNADLRYLHSLPLLECVSCSSSPAIDDQGVAQLASLDTLQVLDLCETSVTDAGLASLEQLFSLNSLNVSNTQITDQGIRSICKIRGIENLRLNKTAVSDTGLNHLATLQNLKWVELYETKVTDQGIEQLASRCRSLEHLDLGNTKVNGSCFKSLSTLPSIHTLSLHGLTGMDARKMAHIAEIPSLAHLELVATDVSTDDLTAFKGHRLLLSLNLTSTNVDDGIIPLLASMPSLEWVCLSGSRVSDLGKRRLQALRPELRVI